MNSQPPSFVAILSQIEEDGRTYKLATIDEIRAAIAAGADAFARDCDGNCALQYMPRRLYRDNPDMVQRLTPPEEH